MAKSKRNKVVAGVLSILLGGIGVQYFYLGKIGKGILCLLFFWTGIPAVIGLVVGIMYLTDSDYEFYKRYGAIDEVPVQNNAYNPAFNSMQNGAQNVAAGFNMAGQQVANAYQSAQQQAQQAYQQAMAQGAAMQQAYQQQAGGQMPPYVNQQFGQAQPQAPQPQESTPKFCTSCGAPLQPGQKFCTSCGSKL